MPLRLEVEDGNLARAAAYLRDNAALRVAVGVGSDAQLVPHELGKGEHNRNYRFVEPASGRAFVLRLNVVSQPFHDDQVAYEYAALAELAPSGRVPQPVYRDSSRELIEEGALVIGFCEGDELDFDHLREGDLRCAAQIMADVHAVPARPDSALFRPADPLAALFAECLERDRRYRRSGRADERLVKWADTLIAAVRPLVEGAGQPGDCGHIVNTEPLPSHFLIPAASAAAAAGASGASGRFCDDPGSFVDWERPLIGEVAQDVAYFTAPTTTFWDSDYLFSADEALRFAEDYWRAVDGRFARGNFDERFRAFRAVTALRSATWCNLASLRYAEGAGTHQTEKTARKLPTYLSDGFLEMLLAEM